MAEETTAAVEEERELASQPIPGLVRKYTIITGQGMLAQIIMVVLEGLVMGLGPGCTRPGLCFDHHVGRVH